MNDKGSVFIINTNSSPPTMHVGLRKEKSNQGTRFAHEPNRQWLSLHLPELITLDPDVHFGKTIPHWKGNLTRKTMG
jgi:hypothetical protein